MFLNFLMVQLFVTDSEEHCNRAYGSSPILWLSGCSLRRRVCKIAEQDYRAINKRKVFCNGRRLFTIRPP